MIIVVSVVASVEVIVLCVIVDGGFVVHVVGCSDIVVGGDGVGTDVGADDAVIVIVEAFVTVVVAFATVVLGVIVLKITMAVRLWPVSQSVKRQSLQALLTLLGLVSAVLMPFIRNKFSFLNKLSAEGIVFTAIDLSRIKPSFIGTASERSIRPFKIGVYLAMIFLFFPLKFACPLKN